jgi:AcrR family transcriptional regulator
MSLSSTDADSEVLPGRPKRVDARRNYERLIAEARVAFTEAGSSASLEDIARRAGVGIGTLYRHFPTRQDLLEAVYLEEVEAMCRSAQDLSDRDPWDALVAWLRRFNAYVATKEALAEELFAYVDRDADVFRRGRDACYAAGEPLLKRAQEAQVVRADTDISDVVRMVVGIAKMPMAPPEQIERILDMALDGLRYQPGA